MEKRMNLEQFEASVWGLIDKLVAVLVLETGRRDNGAVLETLELLVNSIENLQLADKTRVLRQGLADD